LPLVKIYLVVYYLVVWCIRQCFNFCLLENFTTNRLAHIWLISVPGFYLLSRSSWAQFSSFSCHFLLSVLHAFLCLMPIPWHFLALVEHCLQQSSGSLWVRSMLALPSSLSPSLTIENSCPSDTLCYRVLSFQDIKVCIYFHSRLFIYIYIHFHIAFLSLIYLFFFWISLEVCGFLTLSFEVSWWGVSGVSGRPFQSANLFIYLWHWGLNSGLCICTAGVLPLELHLQSSIR
jgi:hypothetical protein